MKNILLIIIVNCWGVVLCQKLDYDQYNIQDVKNISEERRELLNHLSGSNAELDYFKHFYFSSDPPVKSFESDEKDFSLFISTLRKKIDDIKRPNNIKVVKLAYEEVNEKYLKSLDIFSGFSDIFKDGRFNYCTSAALYISVLDRLDIPVKVIEKYTHSEVIAYPESEGAITLIAPNAMKELRFIDISPEFKTLFVNKLKENKLITSAEIGNKTNTEIFNENYYLNNIRPVKEFIGVLYFQECLNVNNGKRPEDNLSLAIVGNIYFPSFRGNMLIRSLTGELLSKRKYETLEDIKYLELISRIPFTCEEESMFMTYGDFTDKTLFEKSNLKLFDTCSNYLLEKTVNKNLRNHVELVYNAERGRFHLLKYDYKKAIPNLLAAHKKAPENIKLRSMAVDAIYQRMKVSDGEDTAGLMNYPVQDSFLLDDSRFRQIYSFFLEDFIVTLYEDNNMPEGDKYIERFEKVISKEPALAEDQDDFSEVYTIPAEYYIKNKNYKKAKEYLNRGLTIFPKSKDIVKLLATIK